MTKYPQTITIEELEKHKNVTDNQIKIDFYNTVKEAKAYMYLRDGYQLCSELPEYIETGQHRNFSYQSDSYHSKRNECLDFLEFLVKLADARNVDLDE